MIESNHKEEQFVGLVIMMLFSPRTQASSLRKVSRNHRSGTVVTNLAGAEVAINRTYQLSRHCTGQTGLHPGYIPNKLLLNVAWFECLLKAAHW